MFFHRTLFRCEGASAVEASKVSFSAPNFINARQEAVGSNTKFKPHRLSILLEAGFRRCTRSTRSRIVTNPGVRASALGKKAIGTRFGMRDFNPCILASQI